MIEKLAQLLDLGAGTGDWVAEAWIEWGLCRGSTLYRQRFPSERRALAAARRAAKKLDDALPDFYSSTDWSGRRIMERYDYSISFVARPLAEAERLQFNPVWSPHMPGSRDSTAEHPSRHPLAGSHAAPEVLHG